MIVCNGLKDWQFIEDVYNAHKSRVDRLNPTAEISEEENQKIINEEKEKYDTQN